MNLVVFSSTVWTLSFVSLLADVASEMLYPVMPLYLETIGFSVMYIGLLEGIAEAVAGYSKGYFGKLSDTLGRRVPFVRIGYAMSSIAKPLIAVAANPLWVFFCRTVDRLGKGVRTGARDAILSQESEEEHRGKVFGLHRAMDTFGAALGPLLALIYLAENPANYRQLFLFALAPGIVATVLTFFVKDKNSLIVATPSKVGWIDFVRYWRQSSARYRSTVIGLLVFALFNSSDLFLLLALKTHGLSDSYVVGIYIFYNLIYAIFAYPAGRLGDKIGFRKTFIGGVFLFALAYLIIALNSSILMLVAAFFIYGLFAAATEGVSKAWLTTLCREEDTATAIGTHAAFSSVASMLASTLAGLVWYLASPYWVFILTASGAVMTVGYFLMRRN